MKYLLFGAVFLPLVNCYKTEIKISNGKIRGLEKSNYISFESIPYAEPPIGLNRFGPPKPYTQNWTDYFNATSSPVDHSLPVMVYIHGGAFSWSSGGINRPDWIMDHGKMILVTFNYRLGSLGFLTTEDDVIAGNMALKDQQLALKWIRTNIEAFGGNTEQIMLTGWSAGGASVQFHLLSSKSRQYFTSAVSFSGSVLTPIRTPSPRETAKKLARILNCPVTEDSKQIKECLISLPADKIVECHKHFLKIFYNPFVVFGPITENHSDHAFITESVTNLMTKPTNIPWITSYTADDGVYASAEFMRLNENGRDYMSYLNENWEDIAPYLFFYHGLNKDEQNKESKRLYKKYFGNGGISPFIWCSFECFCVCYIFNYPSPFGYGNLLSGRTDINFGCGHGDEVLLLFKTKIRDSYPLSMEDRCIQKKLLDMLYEFASNRLPVYDGKPLPSNTPFQCEIQYFKVPNYTNELH
uniref:Carboxylic ester hydrolase n=1 Tax=Megaselia scalaris TaxID=36166 RepID=T1GLE9_MEGSC